MMLSNMDEKTVALYEGESIERFECVLCGEEGFAEFPYEKQGVCAGCVQSLAHSYIMRHGGEPDRRFCSDEEYAALASGRRRTNRYTKIPIPYPIKKAVLERDAYRCQKCGDHHDLHVDHIFPESKGGEATMENLQCLCRTCNIKKGAKV
jgi:hypothetical protein